MMYCSLRVYVDKVPDLVSAQNILGLFELFSNALGRSYDYISYTLFDPEKDCTLIDEKYSYDLAGKKDFLDTSILPVFVGKNGDLSAPFVSATCIGKATQIYSAICVQVQFPVYSEPLIIRVDYEQKREKKLTLEIYGFLIQSLTAMGFHVNNGFYHVYKRKNEAVTLDGGQIGSLISYYGRQNLKSFVMHRKKGCLNSLMGIYCANSIRVDSLNKSTLKEIVDIVGINNVLLKDNVFSFALGSLEKLTPTYRIRYGIMLKKLQKRLIRTKNRLARPPKDSKAGDGSLS